MKKNKIKKILATAMVISISTTILPVSQIAMATTTDNSTYVDSLKTEGVVAGNNQSSDTDYDSEEIPAVYSITTGAAVRTTSAAVYCNDFESEKLPDQVNWSADLSRVNVADIAGNKSLQFDPKFDGTDDWGRNQTSLSFNTSSTATIKADSEIKFDMLIPKTSTDFAGEIKFSGAVKDKDWAWVGAGYGSVKASDFKDEGNGYLRTTVSIKTSKDSDQLNSVIVQISSYNCDYKGNLYIDNLKLIQAGAKEDVVLPSVDDLSWNFDKDISGWNYEGSWAYNGPSDNVVNYDSSIGTGSIKLDVDYSKDASVSWSEFKISNTLSAPIDFNGYNILTYDFIYDPSKMTQGGFKSKLFINGVVDSYDVIKLDNPEDIGNGLKKAKVTIKFDSKDVTIDAITIGIIGASTNYNGSIYIDNIKLSQESVTDIYVEKTEVPTDQDKVNVDDVEMPKSVKLVDSAAIETTADLYAYLKGIGKADKVLYGHQNDTHHKASLQNSGSNSDTKDITGSIAAICGIDALSLTGAELQLDDKDEISLIKKAANLSIATANEGGIITLSAHMPNFALVVEKGKDADGNYDYSGYTPGTTTGNVVSRIMPGGDLNEVYNGYLDMIADYGKELEDAGVPVLFRPFHENNGSWFWWGKAFCDEESYKNMYRYTVEYLRDEKQVHNFLYVYSPNGPFEDKADYLSRYPGDEFIDIIAFDMYHDDPKANKDEDTWMNTLKETIKLVQGIADDKGKLSAVSETGIRINGGGMSPLGNPNKTWFSDIANIVKESDMPYYMVWANFDSNKNFFAPFMVSETKGHEMINDFIDYYNEDESVFANGVGDYSKAGTSKDSAYSYGFITGPTSSSRVLKPTKITASIKGYYEQVKFVLKNKAGESVKTINAELSDGSYSADITQDILDKIGQTIGSIELYSGDTKLDAIKAIFNIKEAEKNPKVVDDFELYSGEDALLQNDWSTNAGAGCSVTPKLDASNKNKGEYGLAFNYKIASGGYAGITKSLTANWSDCDALQFWCKPDGQGQKLVIQVTSNGEDFEVFMPEFAATTEAKLVTLKFSDFVGKNKGTIDLSKISKMGIWCNTIGTDTVNSTMYFDDIKAINTSAPDDGTVEVAMPSKAVINGTQRVGNTLTAELLKADSTEFIPSEDVTYAWYRLYNKDDDIANGTLVGDDETYKLIDSDKGHYIKLVVTYNSKTFENITSSIAKTSSSSSSSSSSSNGTTTTTTGTTTVTLSTNPDGTIKLVDNNGQPATGWQQVNGNWYLANATGSAQTGWQQVNSKWYLLDQTGAMKTGWIKDNNWYYLESSGAMKTGWLLDKDNNWYYLESSGAMKTGWFKDSDRNWYYLKSTGEMAKNESIDGYLLGANGAWII